MNKRPDIAVILAAGLGSRMGFHTNEKPKGFIEIAGEAIIERSVRILLENGIQKIVIGTGYLSGFYERLSGKYRCIRTVKNPDYAETGSFYTLYNMKDVIDGDFLLLESDLLYEKRAVSILCSHEKPDVILASGKTGSEDEVFIETDDENLLVSMSKKAEDLENIYGELVGISRLSNAAFREMIGLFYDDIETARSIEYETALIRLAGMRPLWVEKATGLAWTEIDTDKHLKRAEQIIWPRIQAAEIPDKQSVLDRKK